MIFFSSLAARNSYIRAISDRTKGNQLLFRVQHLINRREPVAIVLHSPSKENEVDKYFDFILYPVSVNEYVGHDGKTREDLSSIEPFDWKNPDIKPLLVGGLLAHEHGWGVHT